MMKRRTYRRKRSIGQLDQGFSNFWCYGDHEEIDHNLRSPTINFINAVMLLWTVAKLAKSVF